MADTETKETEAPEVETPAYSDIEVKILEAAEVLKSNAEYIGAEVDKAIFWSEAVNPAILPMQTLCRNLDIVDKPVKADQKNIAATRDAVDMAGIPVNLLDLLNMVQKVATGLKYPELDNLLTEEIQDIADQLGQAVKSIFVPISDEVRETVKKALAHYQVAKGKLLEWNNKSKRTVPSQVGTSGASGATPTSRPGETLVTRGFKVGYRCEHCQREQISGTNPSAMYHQFREHYRDCNKLTRSETDGTSDAFRTIKRNVDNVLLADNEATMPGIGQLRRVYPS